MTLSAEQLLMRSGPDGFVGASEIAAIVGVSRWRKPIDVWLSKTGRAAPEEPNPRAAVGVRAEAIAFGWYLEDEGLESRVYERGTSVRHPRVRCAGCTPDYLLADESGSGVERLVQIKCVGAHMAQFWPDDWIPDDVECQCQFELECTDAARLDVVAWLGGTDFRIIHVERDREFGEMLLRGAESFWKCIASDSPPPIDGSESWRKYLIAKYPAQERTELVAAGAEVDKWAYESLRCREKIAELEKDQDAADNHLRNLIGDGAGFLGTDYRVTWTPDKNGKRTLRVKRRNTNG